LQGFLKWHKILASFKGSFAMMTQTAPAGEKNFVSTMLEHMDLCAQMGRAYGNERFESLHPYDEVLFAVANHDRGWDDYDQQPIVDPQSGLPFIMAKTPPHDAVKTNKGSPDFNETHNAYSGLLSSMHTWGLYNKRYGFSRFQLRIRPGTTSVPVADANRGMIDALLEGEIARQSRLKSKLAENPVTRPLANEKQIFQNYKQLQFFDTLSLYFHLYHASERGNETYIHVPVSADEDATVEVKQISDRVYSLDPFPFAGDRLTLICKGRYTGPLPAGCDRVQAGALLQSLPADNQTYELVPVR
jgi:hypothetical protein